MRLLALATVLTASLFGAAYASAATFYVSPAGSDANAGTSPAGAWQTAGKVNAAKLAAGDTVLFQGGSSFSGLLQPQGSGSVGAPITLGSYGAGRATLTGGIQLQSQSWLVVDGLRVDTGSWQTAGSIRGLRSADDGSGVQNLVIRNCQFVNVNIGLLISNHLDRNWTVSNNLIQWTRDSGILIFDPSVSTEVGGSDMTFSENQILDTGVDPSITWKKHAVYDIGTNLTWRNNVIRRFSESAFSLRARGNTLIGNTISDGPYAIYYSPYDPTPGTTTIAYNTISNVTQDGIEIGNTGDTADVESFVLANNSISSAGKGIRIVGTAGAVSIANNLVRAADSLLRVDKTPGGGLNERSNLWWNSTGAPSWSYLGSALQTLASYRLASGLGTGDLSVNPLLDANLQLAAASPAIDAGTTSVATYTGDCTGAAFHYCGRAPDLGSVETAAVAGPLTPPAALAAKAQTRSGLTLSWQPSTDGRVVAYRVTQGSATIATTSATTAVVTGLACGTSYTFAVVGLDASGNASVPATTTGSTAACADTVGPTLAITYPTSSRTVPLSFTVSAIASDAGSGIKNVTFWFDGNAPCVDTTAPYVSCAISTSAGVHTIRVRATDNAGNFTEQTIHVWAQKDVRVYMLSASRSSFAGSRRGSRTPQTS